MQRILAATLISLAAVGTIASAALAKPAQVDRYTTTCPNGTDTPFCTGSGGAQGR